MVKSVAIRISSRFSFDPHTGISISSSNSNANSGSSGGPFGKCLWNCGDETIEIDFFRHSQGVEAIAMQMLIASAWTSEVVALGAAVLDAAQDSSVEAEDKELVYRKAKLR